MTGDLPSQPKATILVVDDEAAVRRVLVMRLQLSGYRVICAEDGEQALEMFQAMQRQGVVPDVVMYGVLISAFGKGMEPKRALQLSALMQQHGVVLDAIAISASIDVFKKGKQPE